MKKKASRLDAIKMIISSKEIGSQDELLQELNSEGFELTQATPPYRDWETPTSFWKAPPKHCRGRSPPPCFPVTIVSKIKNANNQDKYIDVSGSTPAVKTVSIVPQASKQ